MIYRNRILVVIWTIIFPLFTIEKIFAHDTSSTNETQYHYPQCKDLSATDASSSDAPISMASLEGEPSAFVHQCVNVISGQFCDAQVDLIAYHGVDPLLVERSYFGTSAQSGKLGPGWTVNHSSQLINEKRPKKKQSCIELSYIVEEDNGCRFVFPKIPIDQSNPRPYPISADCLKKGVTNTTTGYIGGQTNLKNLKMHIPKGNTYRMQSGSGGIKEFSRNKTENEGQLIREIKPSGNTVEYTYFYDRPGSYPIYVDLINSAKQKTNSLNCLKMLSDKIDKKHNKFEVHTQDGRWVRYNFGKISKKTYFLGAVERSDGPTETFSYYVFNEQVGGLETIKRKNLPNGRYIEADYYDLLDNPIAGKNIHIEDPSDPRIYRVSKLLAPAGVGKTPVTIYQFIYHLHKGEKKKHAPREILDGYCEVFNALGHKTQYGFNQDHRLTYVDKFSGENRYTRERLYWGESNSNAATQLLARTLQGNDDSLVFARTYLYDDAGNVLQDCLCGNLSGFNKKHPHVFPKGHAADNGCERYLKKCTYSSDGFNLLLEEDDGFKKTSYRYAPGTNRLMAKFLGSPTDIQQRWFYFYNDDAALIKEIVDDGRNENVDDLIGVSERYITYYTQNEVYPVAYPIVIEEKCLDLETGQEILIRKIVNTYNNLAKIIQQDHYDNRNIFSHSLYWEYDKMGNVTKEVDALGRTTARQFDANGNCIFEQGPDANVHKNMTYDFMNRLIKEEEVHSDGINRTLSHRYDVAGNRIATVDPYGNETKFTHDPFGRIIQIKYPNVLNEKGKVVSAVIQKKYDAMGHVTEEIDAKGIAITTKYTLRGQPALITYPDGTYEQNKYQLNGVLKESRAKNGAITKFTNDLLGRPIKTETYSPKGELLQTTSATYNAFHILTEIDVNGVVTYFSYYPNGLLKSRQKGNNLTTYVYDELGRLACTTEHCGNDNTISKVKIYDLLDRVIEERVETGEGNVITSLKYGYDIAGNLTTVESRHQQGVSVTTTQYDSHGTPILSIDAEGNQTITRNVYDFRNTMGQNVAYQQVIDPAGNLTIIQKDALDRTFITWRKNSMGQMLHKQENRYDVNGNHCLICETISEEKGKSILTEMEYDTANRLVACYEAKGRPEQKFTQVTYNQLGQKENLIKADGIILTHSYEALGRLDTMLSSNHSIHYKYHYDLNGNVVQVDDLIKNISTIKKYNDQNHLVNEIQGNGLKLEYSYDAIGRAVQVSLPDNSTISYSYHANLLKTVTRRDANDKPLYEHCYEAYDPSGRLTTSKLAQSAGRIDFEYDLIGRVVKNESHHWKETLLYDSVSNLTEQQLDDSIGITNSIFTYDDAYQLVSEKGVADHNYSYDMHYNRLTKDGKSHSYNALHQLINDGTFQYTYDANGNMISKASDDLTYEYSYDALDRLISLTTSDQKVQYTYDESNRRLAKTFFAHQNDQWAETKKELYLYQGQNEIGSCNSQGQIMELRVLGSGKGAEIGATVAIEIGDETYVPIHDHNGNIVCLLDLEGDVVETYRYTSFGEELFDEAKIPWRYASKRVDPESGFVYFGRRYYDPAIGRWVTPDPIGREGGPNPYAYVLNNPLTHFDLYGLFGLSEGFSFGDFFESIFSNVVDFCANLLRLPGKALELTGRHLVPIPYVKDAVEFGGWCLGGKDPGAFIPSWKNRCELIKYDGYGDCDPHRLYVTYNGICCSREDAIERAAYLSHKYGGVNVYCIYNASNGLVLDTLEVMCQKLGLPTPAQASAEYETARLARQMGPSGLFFVDAHSQGCETVHNLSPGLKKMMWVSTYGPARVLNPADYYFLSNNWCPLDFVTPIADPWGTVRGIANGTLSFAKPRGCPLFYHFLDGKSYDRVLTQKGLEFTSKWGSVEW